MMLKLKEFINSLVFLNNDLTMFKLQEITL